MHPGDCEVVIDGAARGSKGLGRKLAGEGTWFVAYFAWNLTPCLFAGPAEVRLQAWKRLEGHSENTVFAWGWLGDRVVLAWTVWFKVFVGASELLRHLALRGEDLEILLAFKESLKKQLEGSGHPHRASKWTPWNSWDFQAWWWYFSVGNFPMVSAEAAPPNDQSFWSFWCCLMRKTWKEHRKASPEIACSIGKPQELTKT